MSALLSRRAFLGAAAAGPFIHASRAAQRRRPNFLFLLTDDQSYATLSLTGSPFMKTPHIDRLGREGVLFTNAFVATSLCAPSRACNLSGMYPHRNGIVGNNIRWNQSIESLPVVLHANGWRTAHIGKFHMDGDDRVQPGYDYWAAQVGQGQYIDPRKNINGKWVDLKGYDTDIITTQAIDFMRESRAKGVPFCTWIGYKACHGPFTPAPGHENAFANIEFKPPASFFIDDEGKPARVRQRSQRAGLKKQKRQERKKQQKAGDPPASLAQWADRERNQYCCLMGVEDSAGRLLAFLEEQKVLDDTIIVYAGDNGFFHGEHGLHGKSEPYEEALRVPMLARYPREIKANQRAGAFVANVDLAPTILDFCGVKIPAAMQGRSWRPLVTGERPPSPWRDCFVYTTPCQDAAAPPAKALRTDRYKLILNLNPKDVEELYDLKADPQEMKNLARDSGNRDLVVSLKRKLIAEMKRLEDPALEAVQATL